MFHTEGTSLALARTGAAIALGNAGLQAKQRQHPHHRRAQPSHRCPPGRLLTPRAPQIVQCVSHLLTTLLAHSAEAPEGIATFAAAPTLAPHAAATHGFNPAATVEPAATGVGAAVAVERARGPELLATHAGRENGGAARGGEEAAIVVGVARVLE